MIAPKPALETASERPSARILHLDDGRILRGPARERDHVWQVDTGRERVAVPTDRVVHVRMEREVEAEFAALAARVSARDPIRRVALADGMARAGLEREAFALLDQVLAREPDQPQALALLQRTRRTLRSPSVAAGAELVSAFSTAFANARPSDQELAVLELGRQADPATLQRALSQELASPRAAERRFATLALRRLRPGGALDTLVACALGDPEARVRQGAALAVRAANDPAAAEPLVQALGSPLATRRIFALEALGSAGSAVHASAIRAHVARMSALTGAGGGFPRSNLAVTNGVAYVQDYNVEIAQGASISDPIVAVATEGTVLDVAVGGVGVERASPGAELAAARRALASIQARSDAGAHTVAASGAGATGGSGTMGVR